ncbi:hypothetical protein Hanom_Chr16g01520221 [Helianthus anomalus]
MDEASVQEVKDQHMIDMVKLNALIGSENVPNPHGVAVVRTPTVASNTLEVPA